MMEGLSEKQEDKMSQVKKIFQEGGSDEWTPMLLVIEDDET